MTTKRFTLAGLMSAVVCALMLLSAPAARAQVAAQDSVLLDPFDPVPEIQFRHFGGADCWDDCGYRDCDGCGRCNDGCGRSHCYDRCGRCSRGCYARPRCRRDCDGRVHCERGCRNEGRYDHHDYDRERRFDHDATRVEHDDHRFREDEDRFHNDAGEYERDDHEWHKRYGIDGHWDQGPGDQHWDRDGHDRHEGDGPSGATTRHEEHVQERQEEKHEDRHEEKAVDRAVHRDADEHDDDARDDDPPPARH
jgi:hypothetical protein